MSVNVVLAVVFTIIVCAVTVRDMVCVIIHREEGRKEGSRGQRGRTASNSGRERELGGCLAVSPKTRYIPKKMECTEKKEGELGKERGR